MTFAEGLGGAVLLDGKIYRGRGAAGEVGYMVTDAFGAEGAYHGVGALEGKLFELVAEDARRDGIDPALCEEQTARLVHQLVRSRGAFKLSDDISDQLVRTIGAALASSIALLDPEVVSAVRLDRARRPGDARSGHRTRALLGAEHAGGAVLVIGRRPRRYRAALAACRGTLADVQVVEAAI